MVLEADAALKRLLPQLRDGLLIEIDDQLAVESDLDARAGALDVDAVPLPRGQDRVLARSDVSVQRPARVHCRRFARIVEQLDLIAIERGPSRPGPSQVERAGPDAQTAVAPGGHAKLDMEYEVGERAPVVPGIRIPYPCRRDSHS